MLITTMGHNTWSSKPNFGYSSSGSLLPGSGCSLTRKTSRSLLWNKGKKSQNCHYLHVNTIHVSRACGLCKSQILMDCFIIQSSYFEASNIWIYSSISHKTLPLSSLCCWAKWVFPVAGELSCTPSTCQWKEWYPVESGEKQRINITEFGKWTDTCPVVFPRRGGSLIQILTSL